MIGALVVLTALAAGIAARSGGSRLDKGGTYVWSSGSQVFVDSLQRDEPVNCVVNETQTRWLTIDPAHVNGGNAVLPSADGTVVKRDQTGPIKISCDQPVRITSGSLMWIYPLAATPWPFWGGLILVFLWLIASGNRAGRWLTPRTWANRRRY